MFFFLCQPLSLALLLRLLISDVDTATWFKSIEHDHGLDMIRTRKQDMGASFISANFPSGMQEHVRISCKGGKAARHVNKRADRITRPASHLFAERVEQASVQTFPRGVDDGHGCITSVLQAVRGTSDGVGHLVPLFWRQQRARSLECLVRWVGIGAADPCGLLS